MTHSYGWRGPEAPDARDWQEPKPRRWAIFRLPSSFSLRPKMPSVYDQGNLGSCVGNGTAAGVESEEIKQGEGKHTPSRLFIYWFARWFEGTTKEDAGAYIRDGIKAVAKYGAPAETIWPYNISKFATKPSAKARAAGLLERAITYSRVTQSKLAFQTVLAQGYPIVFGFTVYESFESAEVEATGIVPMPGPDEGILGGHCVLAIGYKKINSTLYVECRNSWGPDWGDHGYFWLPMKYLTDPGLASDFWVIRKVK